MQRMIVIEREALARWIRELKLQQTRNDGVDYYTAYLSALTAVEAYMAMMPEYDLDKLKDLPHPDERPTAGRAEGASTGARRETGGFAVGEADCRRWQSKIDQRGTVSEQDAPETRGRASATDAGRGLFTPEEVCMKMVEHGQGNYKRFKLGDTIQYSPTEVMKILKDELPKAL